MSEAPQEPAQEPDLSAVIEGVRQRENYDALAALTEHYRNRTMNYALELEQARRTIADLKTPPEAQGAPQEAPQPDAWGDGPPPSP
jgi:hypothetical protein